LKRASITRTRHRVKHVSSFRQISTRSLTRKHGREIYDSRSPELRRRVDITKLPLVDNDGAEIHVFDGNSRRIIRRTAIEDEGPSCGVLMDLENIDPLFNRTDTEQTDDNDAGSAPPVGHRVKINAYPLGFLRVAGNIQANGIPHCFHPTITQINENVGIEQEAQKTPDPNDDVYMADLNQTHPLSAAAVKPIASQFYNQIAHRIATRAGRLDSQQGSATAALSGAFAQTEKDRAKASAKQEYCSEDLPSDRFHQRINLPDCPTCCRAELVYSVDVGRLKHKSSRYVTPPFRRYSFSHPLHRKIFDKIIIPLARAWKLSSIREVITHYLFVLKPTVCPPSVCQHCSNALTHRLSLHYTTGSPSL
jgi:hypothetical protein